MRDGLMPAIEHAYRDRWQTSLRDAWEADRDNRSDASFSRLLTLLEQRDRELEAHLRSTTSTTAWITPTLVNSWLNYGFGFRTARYRKIGDITYIEGLVKLGATGTTIFTLPEGFRPPENMLWAGITDPNVFARLDVMSDGRVIVYFTGTNLYASINCSFSTVTT
jgi:hypothetical protein